VMPNSVSVPTYLGVATDVLLTPPPP
jgi:hypothetical protein